MMEFITKYWKTILLGAICLIVGFVLNIIANRQSEQRIINNILAELKPIQDKLNTGRISAEEQKRLIELQAQLALLTT